MKNLPTKKCHHCNGTGVEIDNVATGQLFREIRKRRKISLRQMAQWMQLSASFISDLELGRRRSWHLYCEKYESILNPK